MLSKTQKKIQLNCFSGENGVFGNTSGFKIKRRLKCKKLLAFKEDTGPNFQFYLEYIMKETNDKVNTLS